MTLKHKTLNFVGSVYQHRTVEDGAVSKLPWRDNDVVWSISNLDLRSQRMGTFSCCISYLSDIFTDKPKWHTAPGKISNEKIWIKSRFSETHSEHKETYSFYMVICMILYVKVVYLRKLLHNLISVILLLNTSDGFFFYRWYSYTRKIPES